jgi:hypothetical protein
MEPRRPALVAGGQEAPAMAQQIQIERKSTTSKSTTQARQDAALDLRTPSGKKLPY